jgi:type IV secretory pathway TraG/TraD family ATPase VirD4
MGWFKKKHRPPDSGAYPTSRWANLDDLKSLDEGRENAFEPNGGLPVGHIDDREFYDPGVFKRHRAIFGTTGSGKSNLYTKLCLSNAAKEYNIIAVDTAGDLSANILKWRSMVSRCFAVDPSGLLRGVNIGKTKLARWSATADYLRDGSKISSSRAERLASYISRNHERDRFFSLLSQRGIQGGIMAKAIHDPNHATLPEIMKLYDEDFFEWVRWLFRQRNIDPRVLRLLKTFLLPKGKEFEIRSLFDVITTVASETKWLLNEEIEDSYSGHDFSFAPTDDTYTVMLCAPLNKMADGQSRSLPIQLGCAIDQIQTKSNAKGTIVIADELPWYCSDAVADSLRRLFATGRKYGVCAMVSATSLSQLSKECFKNGTHNDVLGNCSVLHYLNLTDLETTDFVKTLSGERVAYSQTRTRGFSDGKSSSSSTISPHTVPLIRAQEVRSVSRKYQIVRMDGCPHLIFCENRPFYEMPELKARAGKNPFLKDSAVPAPKSKAKRKKVDEVAILTKVWR